MSSVLGPCPAIGGDHDWREGGARDRGRYHCARCYVVLHPLDVVRDLRIMRTGLTIALQLDEPASVERVEAYFADWIERQLPEVKE
jgi:hypothetical protein